MLAGFTLDPHDTGEFVRLWYDVRKIDEHEFESYRHQNVLRCKYCKTYWERGTYAGRPYRKDSRDGWWEYDDGRCECIYFTKYGTVMSPGKRFFAARQRLLARPQITVQRCVLPAKNVVNVGHETLIKWDEIIPSLTCLGQKLVHRFPRFQARLRERQQDGIGSCLHPRQWGRARLCNYSLSKLSCPADIVVSKFLPERLRRRDGYRVVWRYSREDHRLYDPAGVDTIVYLPIGTFLWLAQDDAPKGVPDLGWIWVSYRAGHWVHDEAGWIHPEIICSNKAIEL